MRGIPEATPIILRWMRQILGAADGDLYDQVIGPLKGENYDKLFTALEAIGSGYWDCLDSTWLVITEKTPVQIKDELKQYLKDDDRLLVMRYGEGAAWLDFRTSAELGSKTNFELKT